ncbi:hypothetical protein [Actinomadura sp. 9N215]|uniref:hypothetical protein n=1 Tax=Actinomadura sp. 9N215 TaxID=3375150 RepID=UPI0037A3F114
MSEQPGPDRPRWREWLDFVERHTLLVQVLGGIAASTGFSVVTYLFRYGTRINLSTEATVTVLSTIGFTVGCLVLVCLRSSPRTWQFVSAFAVTIFAAMLGVTILLGWAESSSRRTAEPTPGVPTRPSRSAPHLSIPAPPLLPSRARTEWSCG